MESIALEMERVAKRQKTLNSETVQNIDKIIQNLKSSASGPEIQNIASRIQESYKDQQLVIHKYNKVVEKRWKQVCMCR
jgi:DNA-binding ferritin-like protein